MLNDTARQRSAATEARAFGHGGISAVARAAGFCGAFRTGVRECGTGRQRCICPRDGADAAAWGRAHKRRATQDPTLLGGPGDPGGPEQAAAIPLCRELQECAAPRHRAAGPGHQVSPQLVSEERPATACREHARRTKAPSTKRDAQFDHMHRLPCARLLSTGRAGHLGRREEEGVDQQLKNAEEWHPQGQAAQVRVYDFVGELGKAIPYGVYDLSEQSAGSAWAFIGTRPRRGRTIRCWWGQMGQRFRGRANS